MSLDDTQIDSRLRRRYVRIMKDVTREAVENQPFSNWGYVIECSDVGASSEVIALRQTQIWTTKMDLGYVTACLRSPPLPDVRMNKFYTPQAFGQIIALNPLNKHPKAIDKLMHSLSTQEAYRWLNELPTYEGKDLTRNKSLEL